MHRLLLVFLVVLVAGSLAAEKTTMAFIGLEASGVSETDVKGIADTFLDALVNTMRFEIVERERLNALMDEQGLTLSGCTTTECFVKVGQLAGASKVIVGDVSKVGETYTITVRVVDVSRGTIERSVKAESKILEYILSALCPEMADRLVANIPVVGTVVSVSGDTVKLNLGMRDGVKEGDTVELYRLGEECYDPETGAFLGCGTDELGEAKITKVLADELSEAVFSGDVPPITGDKVRLGGMIETGEPEVITITTTSRPHGAHVGVTLNAPFLFATNNLYGDYEDSATKGIQLGGNLMVEIFIQPWISLGPYLGFLTYKNEIDSVDLWEEDTFTEMLYGLGLKVRLLSTGTMDPYLWLSAGIGGATASCDTYGSLSDGGFGLNFGLGGVFLRSSNYSLGFGFLFHYNGVTGVFDTGEPGDTGVTSDSLKSFGGVLDYSIYF